MIKENRRQAVELDAIRVKFEGKKRVLDIYVSK